MRACERNGRNLGLKKTRGNYEGREGKRWRKEKIRLETCFMKESKSMELRNCGRYMRKVYGEQ